MRNWAEDKDWFAVVTMDGSPCSDTLFPFASFWTVGIRLMPAGVDWKAEDAVEVAARAPPEIKMLLFF